MVFCNGVALMFKFNLLNYIYSTNLQRYVYDLTWGVKFCIFLRETDTEYT